MTYQFHRNLGAPWKNFEKRTSPNITVNAWNTNSKVELDQTNMPIDCNYKIWGSQCIKIWYNTITEMAAIMDLIKLIPC